VVNLRPNRYNVPEPVIEIPHPEGTAGRLLVEPSRRRGELMLLGDR
jgi:hypothetical protein